MGMAQERDESEEEGRPVHRVADLGVRAVLHERCLGAHRVGELAPGQRHHPRQPLEGGELGEGHGGEQDAADPYELEPWRRGEPEESDRPVQRVDTHRGHDRDRDVDASLERSAFRPTEGHRLEGRRRHQDVDSDEDGVEDPIEDQVRDRRVCGVEQRGGLTEPPSSQGSETEETRHELGEGPGLGCSDERLFVLFIITRNVA